MAQLYKMLDGFRIISVQPRNKKKFSLEKVQEMIGGYVEIVYLNGDDILLCDEEGRLKSLPTNQKQWASKGMSWLVMFYS